MKRFEYMITYFMPEDDCRDVTTEKKFEDYLNDYGVDGWELVNVEPGMSGRKSCIFKMEVKEKHYDE